MVDRIGAKSLNRKVTTEIIDPRECFFTSSLSPFHNLTDEETRDLYMADDPLRSIKILT